MEAKPQYQMNMLARAQKDGEVMHPGLAKWEKEDERAHKNIAAQGWVMAEKFYKKPDLGALIAAAQEQGLMVIFPVTGNHVVVGNTDGRGPDNLTALIDAIFKATESAEPDNWVGCSKCGDHPTDLDKYGESEVCICKPCQGTGKMAEVPHDAR